MFQLRSIEWCRRLHQPNKLHNNSTPSNVFRQVSSNRSQLVLPMHLSLSNLFWWAYKSFSVAISCQVSLFQGRTGPILQEYTGIVSYRDLQWSTFAIWWNRKWKVNLPHWCRVPIVQLALATMSHLLQLVILRLIVGQCTIWSSVCWWWPSSVLCFTPKTWKWGFLFCYFIRHPACDKLKSLWSPVSSDDCFYIKNRP